MVTVTGGGALEKVLGKIAENVAKSSGVSVGFLADATYPDGTSVAMIAAVQEFGANIEMEERTQTVYRQTNKAGTEFNRNGRFVKKSEANFASDHTVAAHTVTIPPRPFFRSMINNKSPEWPNAVADALKRNKYDAEKTLNQVGNAIKGQLQSSIEEFNSVPLAPSTIAAKGNDKQLIETGTLYRSADYRVD